MEVQFNNVTITIEAATPVAAYNRLCEILEAGVSKGELEYTTDTFIDPETQEVRDTSELWPQEPEDSSGTPRCACGDALCMGQCGSTDTEPEEL